MDLKLVGTIVTTHGIRGEVKVKSDTSFSRFEVGNTLYLKKDGQLEKIVIDSHRVHKDLDLIKFNNLNNINDVLKYIGFELYVDVEDLDELEDDEYYYDDLIDLDVYDNQNNLIGKVIDISEVPQGIILEVKRPNKEISLIPFVEEFIDNINLEEGKIIIIPIEGLLWE